MDVSIIIVNYNTCKITCDCIESVLKQTKNINFEIIVVDNNSSDHSREVIPQKYPNVEFIQSEVNSGFGAANNLGAKYAKGKYLFLLNSDTLLLNNAVKLFADFAENNIKDEILGTYLLDRKGNVINSGGDLEDRIHIYVRMMYIKFPLLAHIRDLLPTRSYVINDNEVGYVTGADMFIRSDTYRKIGGFDEQFFMYSEDMDLCKRARMIGVNSRLIREPIIIHLEGKSGNASEKIRKIRIGSYKKYLKKWF